MSTAEQGPEHDCQATQATIAPLLKESEVDKKRHNRFLEELGLAGSDDVIGFPLLNVCKQSLAAHQATVPLLGQTGGTFHQSMIT